MAKYQESQIRKLDLTGPERRLGSAVRALGRISESFAKAAKRSLPFLGRQKRRLLAGDVTLGAALRREDDSPGPTFRVLLESQEANSWAMVRLDTGALAVVLDGALGSTQLEAALPLEELFGKELSSAQRALIGRVAQSVAEDFAAAVKHACAMSLTVSSAEALRAGEVLDLPKDAICASCTFEGGTIPAHVELYIGAEALEAAVHDNETVELSAGDPRMALAIRGVTVPVVAELGRLDLSLARVLSLNVGETLRLESAVDEPVTLRVSGVAKFDVVPVVSRGQLAVQIKDRLRGDP